jgi:alpha-galactosidase/6-phospho-beta-glucosidase family protein
MQTKTPVIVIIGAGSLYFGKKAVWAACCLPEFKGCTLRLVDTNPENLDRMVRLGHLAAKTVDSATKVEGFSDFRSALPGADFVVLSFSQDNTRYRRMDCDISARFGIRMCSGDTIGPGGVFRTLREFPLILEVARAVETLCPNAWVINYVNPSAIMGIGLMRYSSVKSFALCDTHHMPYKKAHYLNMIGESAGEGELDMRIAGVNHFTWMLKADLRGRNIMPEIVEAFRQEGLTEKDQGYAKARFNHTITAQLADLFGAVPTCTGHTKEYLPYYQGHAAIREPVPPLSVFDCDQREERTDKMWIEIEELLAGKVSMEGFLTATTSDHATDVIREMWVGGGQTFYINVPNTNCTDGGGSPVANLPEDAFLELECELGMDGPRPLPVGEFPLGLRSLQMQILDAHELTIEAIVKKDRSLLVRSLAIDPLVQSISTAEAVIDALYAGQKDILPEWVGLSHGHEKNHAGSSSGRRGVMPQLY